MLSKLVNSDDSGHLAIVASAYSQFSPETYAEIDITALKAVLQSKDMAVATPAPHAWKNLLWRDAESAFALLEQAELCVSNEITHEYLMWLCGNDDTHLKKLSEENVKCILNQLLEIKQIDDYFVQRFFRYILHKHTGVTIAYFKNKLEKDFTGSSSFFSFYTFDERYIEPLDFCNHEDAQKWLFFLFDWAVLFIETHECEQEFDQRRFTHMFGALIAILYDPLPKHIVDAFTIWLNGGNHKKFLLIQCIVEEMPNDFIFEHQGFVSTLLSTAQSFGNNAVERTQRKLLRSLSCTVWTGRDHLKEQKGIEMATELRNRSDRFSPVYSFYNAVIDDLKNKIEMARRWKEDED